MEILYLGCITVLCTSTSSSWWCFRIGGTEKRKRRGEKQTEDGLALLTFNSKFSMPFDAVHTVVPGSRTRARSLQVESVTRRAQASRPKLASQACWDLEWQSRSSLLEYKYTSFKFRLSRFQTSAVCRLPSFKRLRVIALPLAVLTCMPCLAPP